jgi:hypothetical protein
MTGKISIFILVMGIISGTICPPPESIVPPFAYDPEECQYRILGSVQMNVGNSFAIPIGACDPDGDALVFTLDNQPEGMILDLGSIEPNMIILVWKATAAGIYYPNITVTDMPVDGIPLFDRGTIVVRIWEFNQAPILSGFGSADLNFDGTVNFADFAIFVSHWLKSVKD